ncbi:PLAT/LH2 domain-containing protein [Streptomyces aidingensis]|uniref:PLAT/LH2 domain-containing protein n=1 Tax=Streptomyces aidingensis TaxID=910347 RepID=A0A1I1P603_9ACTN|nr:PLAT/LH2 domain-containing protein [Streptomyces aidingensis]SFD02423.1 PLAT/LH2 domain-containing protein [Streptomyces aidingensis]
MTSTARHRGRAARSLLVALVATLAALLGIPQAVAAPADGGEVTAAASYYTVSVYTGTGDGSGNTNSDLYVNLIGTDGESGWKYLGRDFPEGSRRDFPITTDSSLGQVIGVQYRLDVRWWDHWRHVRTEMNEGARFHGYNDESRWYPDDNGTFLRIHR